MTKIADCVETPAGLWVARVYDSDKSIPNFQWKFRGATWQDALSNVLGRKLLDIEKDYGWQDGRVTFALAPTEQEEIRALIADDLFGWDQGDLVQRVLEDFYDMYSQDPDSFHGYCQDQADLLISSLLHESIVIDD